MIFYIDENFCQGAVDIIKIDENYAKCSFVRLDEKTNNLYNNAINFLKEYGNTELKTDKENFIKEIIKIFEQYKKIKDFCCTKYSSFGKIIMEDEFENIYKQLETICKNKEYYLVYT